MDKFLETWIIKINNFSMKERPGPDRFPARYTAVLRITNTTVLDNCINRRGCFQSHSVKVVLPPDWDQLGTQTQHKKIAYFSSIASKIISKILGNQIDQYKDHTLWSNWFHS